MTEEEWAREHATVIDVEPAFGDGREDLVLVTRANQHKAK